ncbi:MAG TPA: ABC transporter permease [Pilimelia sp.]|nr:ABC transporter permease [Pilimelia sp.]
MTAPVADPAVAAFRPPSARHFARLKLRVLRNGFRGQGWRVTLFVLGCLFGLWFAAMGFFAFAAPSLAGDADRDVAVLVLALGGGALVLGWLLLPLVFFGVDETLDPARFALLPLPRRTLLAGLLAAGFIGIPAVATGLATAGSVVTAATFGGAGAALVQAIGVAGGLLLCVAASRAITSGFATMLRSRRMRDLAAIMLAVLAALLGPLQIGVIVALNNADLDQLVRVARVVEWTPFGAPYTAGLDVAEGRPLAAAAKLLGTAAVIAALLWWWSRSVESAMLGTASAGTARPARAPAGGPMAQLFPRALRWLRPGQHGAIAAREARYWWRDARRRASLITLAVVGVFVPLMFNVGVAGLLGDESSQAATSPTQVTISMLFVGSLAALSLANQFGYDGSAYAAHVVVGVPGRVELRARVLGFSMYMVPLLAGIAVLVAIVLGRFDWLPVMWGGLAAAYGTGLAVNLFVSILAAYALPDTANPFAISTGAGMAKSLLSFVALFASLAAAAVYAIVSFLVPEGLWLWLALPVGLAYGVGATVLGCYLAGDVLDRRGPELLATVSSKR